MNRKHADALFDVLIHPLFENTRKAVSGTLSAQELHQLTVEEKTIALYLLKLGRLIHEYKHNHKSTICSNS